ncbi:MAG TPA: phosphatase PAP2 family protein [Elusimicrobia bacterium]|nr:phosphatase PAP2 family protein [Elusimicrobiota bacterium]
MKMFLSWLGSADRWLLLKINRDWTRSSLDALMPVITDIHKVPWFIYGVVPAALGLWLWKGRKRALRVLVVGALAVAAADALAYRVVKPWAARLRPERAGVAVERRGRSSGGTNGFPSNHAANAGAAAAVLSIAYPAAAPAFAAAAGLVAYSRVYCGVHYPLDVLGGLLLGVAMGWPWALLMLGGSGADGSSRKRRK